MLLFRSYSSKSFLQAADLISEIENVFESIFTPSMLLLFCLPKDFTVKSE